MPEFQVVVKFKVEARDDVDAYDIIDNELTESANSYTLGVFDPVISSVITRVGRRFKRTSGKSRKRRRK